MLVPAAVRRTLEVVRPDAWHLSPAIGLALGGGGAHLVSRLYALEPAGAPLSDGAAVQGPAAACDGFGGGAPERWRGSATARLSRDLFHRVEPDEPLRPTANRSLPAAHLSPSLTAHVVGLAQSGMPSAAVHRALSGARCAERGITLPALCRDTGVSIARFERLVAQAAAADADGAPGPRGWGTPLLLRHLWLRSSAAGKPALWSYLRTLHAHYGPVLTDGALGASGGPTAASAPGDLAAGPPPPAGWVDARWT